MIVPYRIVLKINIMKKCLFVAILIMACYTALAQSCPDFTDLTDPGVQCYYGSFNSPYIHTGIVPNRHTVISTQGTDPNTGGQLPLLPEGETQVVRIGNDSVGAQSEVIVFNFVVDPRYAILFLKFAVVLEDPDHPREDQPFFSVSVQGLRCVHPLQCSHYEVCASGSIPGFQTYIMPDDGREIRWRPWTNMSIDLSDCVGQNVTVRLLTRDCSWGDHFGYAYFTAHCIPSILALDTCIGDSVTLSAPPGFNSYHWTNGQTGMTAQYAVTDTGTFAKCLMTNDMGCTLGLNAFVFGHDTVMSGQDTIFVPLQDTIIYDTICAYERYTGNFYDFYPQYVFFNYETHVHLNSFYNSTLCNGNVISILYLTVLNNQFHYYASICEGEDYNGLGFHLDSLSPGSYTETRTATSPTGCDSVITLYLTVVPSTIPPVQLIGETHPCQWNIYTYTFLNSESLPNFCWSWSTGIHVLNERHSSTIVMFFTSEDSVKLKVSASNICASIDTSIIVVPVRQSRLVLFDTICTGQEYHDNGFDLPVQDSVGYFIFEEHIPIAFGCDSVRVLNLLVTPTPAIAVQAQDELICIGEESFMQAQAFDHPSNFEIIKLPPPVSIGDILCTDSSFVKPDAYENSGKTAMGIVFYVDNTGEHGWAVALNDCGTSFKWGPYSDNTELVDYNTARIAGYDIDGKGNTLTLQNEYGDNFVSFSAAYNAYHYNHLANAVDGAHHGWYLPAAGQLRFLFAQILSVNHALTTIGGTPFPMNEAFWYWSNTEYNKRYAWRLGCSTISGDDGFSAYNSDKYSFYAVRCVRNF